MPHVPARDTITSCKRLNPDRSFRSLATPAIHSALIGTANMAFLEGYDISTSRASLERRLHQAPHISAAWCGDELVLLNATTGRYFTLNHVGGRIWELLATSRSANDLALQLDREYEVQPATRGATLQRDVVRMLDDMFGAGLLVAENPAAAAEPPL